MLVKNDQFIPIFFTFWMQNENEFVLGRKNNFY